jgi:hypothetical protein
MVSITTRAGKGSALTTAEMDANLTDLNSGKVEGTMKLTVNSSAPGSPSAGDLWVDTSLGNLLCVFTPLQNTPPGTSYASVDIRNNHAVLDFADAADESALFTGILPRYYGGGGVTVRLIWAATSATSGTCRWSVAFERLADADTQTDDLDTDSFATAQTTGASPPSGNAGQLQYTDIAFTDGAQMDSIAVGEMFRLKVMRDADGTSGTDDMTGDAELVAVEIRET